MKVELDLSAEQLNLLDENLKDCLLSLTDSQKIDIIKNYMDNQLENFREPKRNGWGDTKYEYSDFGKQMIEGLQDKLKDSLQKTALENEEIKNYMNETIEWLKENISKIMQEAISKYIIENLFYNKSELENKVRGVIWSMQRG